MERLFRRSFRKCTGTRYVTIAISDVAFQVGDYLAKQVDPKNHQERVLSDLWSVACPDEQQAIANLMIKLVQNK